MNKRGKRGQIKLSFGMIFSIIMIIIFIVFAFYAIRTFFGLQQTAQTGKFLNDFRSDIDTIWKSTEGSQEVSYSLSNKISHVCFADFEFNPSARGPRETIYSEIRFAHTSNENLVFYPLGFSNPEAVEIKKIDLLEITNEENPFCIENEDGTLNMVLTKDFGEPLVKIERQD